MLPSSQRLTRTQFNTLVTKDHKVVFNRLGTLKYTLGNKAFSVVTSSKNEKKAVIRNKVRRRLYSLFHQEDISMEAVIYVSKHSYVMDFIEIKTLFHDLISKTKKHS